MSYQTNIIKATDANTFFRKVLFTGAKSQLVVMCIEVGGEIGEETHELVEQALFNLSGDGMVILDGVESPFLKGDVVVVTPGTRHNFKNTGSEVLKIYTIYSPANHIDKTVHETKLVADADIADEEFGASVE